MNDATGALSETVIHRRHLADSIRTGTFCSYRPVGVVPRWETT